MMRISFDIPNEWSKAVKVAAAAAGAQSVSDYLRMLIERAPEITAQQLTLPALGKSWGGRRAITEDEQVTFSGWTDKQDTQLDELPQVQQVHQVEGVTQVPQLAQAKSPKLIEVKPGVMMPDPDEPGISATEKIVRRQNLQRAKSDKPDPKKAT